MCIFFNVSRSGYYGYAPRMNIPSKDLHLAEIFFSILKTECIYRTKLQTYENARLLIGEYIHFYSNERIQLKNKTDTTRNAVSVCCLKVNICYHRGSFCAVCTKFAVHFLPLVF